MRHRTNKRKTNRRIRGGNYTSSVYGDMGGQTAALGRGNEIQTHDPMFKGGKQNKNGGGLTELAVPAVLLYGNHLFGSKDKSKKAFSFKGGRRRSSRNKTVRFRRSRR